MEERKDRSQRELQENSGDLVEGEGGKLCDTES